MLLQCHLVDKIDNHPGLRHFFHFFKSKFPIFLLLVLCLLGFLTLRDTFVLLILFGSGSGCACLSGVFSYYVSVTWSESELCFYSIKRRDEHWDTKPQPGSLILVFPDAENGLVQ